MNPQPSTARTGVRSRDRHQPRAETAALNAGTLPLAGLADAPAGIGPRSFRHLGLAPSVHPDAYVAPTAVLSGQVSVSAGSCIMHCAVLAAEGGPVHVGAGCVIMENAVLRGTPRHRLVIGDGVLAARGRRGRRGRPPGRRSGAAGPHPGWVVAVGDPARAYPPGQAEAIAAALAQTGWSFLPVIFGVDDAVAGRRDQLRAALQRHTAALARHHRRTRPSRTPARRLRLPGPVPPGPVRPRTGCSGGLATGGAHERSIPLR